MTNFYIYLALLQDWFEAADWQEKKKLEALMLDFINLVSEEFEPIEEEDIA